MGGPNAKLYFGGNVTVFDNYGLLGENQQMNLVLSENTNAVINTTEPGLTDGVIGVYAIEGTPFEEHGLPGMPFGTFGDAGRVNPQVFRSDHALSLYGVSNESNPSDILIYWVDVICKLTDDNDKILYQNISLNISGNPETRKAQAVYARITDYGDSNAAANGFNVLRDGFDAAQGTLYSRNGDSYTAYPNTAGTVVKLKMLKDYGIDKSIQYQGRRMVTFTTAETGSPTDTMKAWGDYFCFHTGRTEANDKALITRAYDGASMIVDAGTALTLTDITLDGLKSQYASSVNGGIVNVASGSALTVTDGATLQNSETTGSGGAVYVAANGTATVNGGTINGNTAANGAGIYLTEGSKLYLSGDPNFGGPGTQADGSIDSSAGNLKDGTLSGKTNGGSAYTKARQDIFIEGYQSSEDEAKYAVSLIVNGKITSEPGSIWVWAAETPHYKTKCQFGKFEGTNVDEDSLKAFRNAQDDAMTEAPGEYLYGVKQEEDAENIYWSGVSGSRKVILRKVRASTYEPVTGPKFTICSGNGTTPYKVKNDDGTTTELKDLPSLSSGVFWIGVLPYGDYTIRESNGKSFALHVGDDTMNESGVIVAPGSRDGVTVK